MVRQDDAKGNSTWIGYNDDNSNKYAFPTSVKNVYSQTTNVNYDYNIGKPTSVVDPNGVQTLYSFNDALDRVTQIRKAAGIGGVESQSNVVYTGSDALPDTFRDNAQALADGRLGPDGVFQANSIHAKCASKYEAKPPHGTLSPEAVPSKISSVSQPALAAGHS